MEVSIHAEYLRAQMVSANLSQVYGRGPKELPVQTLGNAQGNLPVSRFDSEAAIVSLSYQSIDIRISTENGNVQESGETEDELELPEEFSPEAVSDRILDFVKSLFDRFSADDPNGDIQGFAGQIFQGVEQGFKEAREILESVRMMTDSISKIIGETHRLTTNKLQDFFGSLGVILDGLAPSATPQTTQAT